MVKITAVLSIMIIFTGSIWAAKTCFSCGSECIPACGTRYFRSCCFNYLRKKRVPDQLITQKNDWIREKNLNDLPDVDGLHFLTLNLIPDDVKIYSHEDTDESRM